MELTGASFAALVARVAALEREVSALKTGGHQNLVLMPTRRIVFVLADEEDSIFLQQAKAAEGDNMPDYVWELWDKRKYWRDKYRGTGDIICLVERPTGRTRDHLNDFATELVQTFGINFDPSRG